METIWNINELKRQATAVTIGFFDGIHRGHTFLLEQLKKTAEEKHLRSMVITFFPHPREVIHVDYKPQMLNTMTEKLELLGNTDIDSCLILSFNEALSKMSAYDFMKFLKEKVGCTTLLVGYDHRFGKNRANDFYDYKTFGETLGIEVIKTEPFIEDNIHISSSVIRKLIAEGNLEKANKYLGYHYTLSGKVVEGFKQGKRIGFPTANISPDSLNKLLPAIGVYIVKITFEGQEYNGVLNIGYRPTLKNGEDLTIETHLIDYSGDLYDKEITIHFYKKMRNERKFSTIEELANQIRRDERLAREYFK